MHLNSLKWFTKHTHEIYNFHKKKWFLRPREFDTEKLWFWNLHEVEWCVVKYLPQKNYENGREKNARHSPMKFEHHNDVSMWLVYKTVDRWLKQFGSAVISKSMLWKSKNCKDVFSNGLFWLVYLVLKLYFEIIWNWKMANNIKKRKVSNIIFTFWRDFQCETQSRLLEW